MLLSDLAKIEQELENEKIKPVVLETERIDLTNILDQSPNPLPQLIWISKPSFQAQYYLKFQN